jgi:hypothetical protein
MLIYLKTMVKDGADNSVTARISESASFAVQRLTTLRLNHIQTLTFSFRTK